MYTGTNMHIMYVYSLICAHVQQLHNCRTSLRTSLYAYKHIQVYIYTHMCIHIYIYIFIYMYIYIYVYIHICIYMYMYMINDCHTLIFGSLSSYTPTNTPPHTHTIRTHTNTHPHIHIHGCQPAQNRQFLTLRIGGGGVLKVEPCSMKHKGGDRKRRRRGGWGGRAKREN